MLSSKIKNEELEESYKNFISSNNSVSHRKAIEKMLGIVGLKSEFKRSLKFGTERIIDVYCNFGDAAYEDWVKEEEKESIKNIGALFKRYYKEKDYRKFVETGYNLMFKNLADYLKLAERNDFQVLTDDDLYKENLLPKEIFLQYFLIETMIKNKSFDWHRGQEIINQNLVCFDVCFSDIYAFLNGE